MLGTRSLPHTLMLGSRNRNHNRNLPKAGTPPHPSTSLVLASYQPSTSLVAAEYQPNNILVPP